MLFAKAQLPTPALNTPDFFTVFSHPLPLCKQGLLRPVEFIALPNTPFQIIRQMSEQIYQVITTAYPSESLFVDGRFLTFSKLPFSETKQSRPSTTQLLDTLYSRIGLPYIWGGNWSEGIPELLEYYPATRKLSENERTLHTLHGVDCSGLLYEATGGFTPRNTTELLFFGKSVPLEGRSTEEIASELHPLDLIVWKGHVVIVGKESETIEAHRLHGVVASPLKEQLHHLMQTKRCVDIPTCDPSTFVIRRWASEHGLSPQEERSLHLK